MQFTIANPNTRTAASTGRTNFFTNPTVRLWTVQSLLAALFLFAGATKLVMPADELTKNSDLSASFLRFIGVCELLGGIGLVAPSIFRIRRELTSLAATGLAIIMVGAVVTTAAAGDVVPALVPLVVGVLCAYVAVRRREHGPSRFGRKFDYAAN
jgi:peptidoglycan/LPS O-acetylase OafA/YrhL